MGEFVVSLNQVPFQMVLKWQKKIWSRHEACLQSVRIKYELICCQEASTPPILNGKSVECKVLQIPCLGLDRLSPG